MEEKYLSGGVNKKSAVIGIVLIGALLAGFVAYKIFESRKNKEVFLPNSPVQVIDASEAFPREYVLETGVNLIEPQLLDYESGERLWRTSYNSTKVASEALAIYELYFQMDGWTITNSNKNENSSFIYADKEKKQITIFAQKTPTGSSVAITILER